MQYVSRGEGGGTVCWLCLYMCFSAPCFPIRFVDVKCVKVQIPTFDFFGCCWGHITDFPFLTKKRNQGSLVNLFTLLLVMVESLMPSQHFWCCWTRVPNRGW